LKKSSIGKEKTKWRAKLERDHPSHGKIVDTPPKMRNRTSQGRMLIPEPLKMDALIRTIKKGKLVTIPQLMDRLAKVAGADCACPMTTGIFLRIVAETAEEDLREGRKRITPYWRVLKKGGLLNPKYPGGVQAQAARLQEEGHGIQPGTGKKPPVVTEYETVLVKL
jgi:alkylated DNA nucleotide flippase Atl1